MNCLNMFHIKSLILGQTYNKGSRVYWLNASVMCIHVQYNVFMGVVTISPPTPTHQYKNILIFLWFNDILVLYDFIRIEYPLLYTSHSQQVLLYFDTWFAM